MSAADRGWGPGWPKCQRDKMVDLTVKGARFPGGVHRDVHAIFVDFLTEFDARVEDLHDYGDEPDDWGFACRAIGGTSTPSNHSWGLAVDVNAPEHWLGQTGTFTKAQEKVIASLCEKYTLRWGGTYRRPDEMHFEYMGTRKQAQAYSGIKPSTGDEEMLNTESPSGSAVAWFQKALLGWNKNALPKYGADGDYGSETETWVKKYQEAADLEVTGSIGEVTATLLARFHPENKGAGSHNHDKRYARSGHDHKATVILG